MALIPSGLALVSLCLSKASLWHALEPSMTPLVDPLALLQPPDRGRRSHTYVRDPLTPMDGPKTRLDSPQTPQNGPHTPLDGPQLLWMAVRPLWLALRPLLMVLKLLFLALRNF